MLFQPIHFYVESGVRDRGLVLLRQVELALLLKLGARGALVERALYWGHSLVSCWVRL